MLNTIFASDTERYYYERRLARDHQRWLVAVLMDRNHQVIIPDIGDRILSGTVNLDAGAENYTRTLSAVILDPNSTLGLDTGNPADGVLEVDRMIRIYWVIHVPEIDKNIACPIFTGPILDSERDGPVITIEAQSKEVLAAGIWQTFTVPKGTNRRTAIQTIMNNAGEINNNMTLAKVGPKVTLPADVKTVRVQDRYFDKAKKVADSLNMLFYYNGYGRIIMRKKDAHPVFLFKDGDYGNVLTEPRIAHDGQETLNVVQVIGKTPAKGGPPSSTVTLGGDHPMGPAKLKRGGKYYYKGEVIQNDSYTTVAQCEAFAKSHLDQMANGTLELTFDSLVIPHLENWDYVQIKTDSGVLTNFRLKTLQIPLDLSDDTRMTVGYTDAQSKNPADVALIRSDVR